MTTQARTKPYLPSRTKAKVGDLVLIEWHVPMRIAGLGRRFLVEYDIHQITAVTGAGQITATRDRWISAPPAPFRPQRSYHGRTIERWTIIPAEDVEVVDLWSKAVEHTMAGHPAQPAPWPSRYEPQTLIRQHVIH